MASRATPDPVIVPTLAGVLVALIGAVVAVSTSVGLEPTGPILIGEYAAVGILAAVTTGLTERFA